MTRSCYLRHIGQQRHIVGARREFVIAEERTEGRTAGSSVLFLINKVEERTAVNCRRILKLLHKLSLGKVIKLYFQPRAEIAFPNQLLKTPPRPFKLLKLILLHHRGKLLGRRLINLFDSSFDSLGDVMIPGDYAIKGFLNNHRQQLLGCFGLSPLSSLHSSF